MKAVMFYFERWANEGHACSTSVEDILEAVGMAVLRDTTGSPMKHYSASVRAVRKCPRRTYRSTSKETYLFPYINDKDAIPQNVDEMNKVTETPSKRKQGRLNCAQCIAGAGHKTFEYLFCANSNVYSYRSWESLRDPYTGKLIDPDLHPYYVT